MGVTESFVFIDFNLILKYILMTKMFNMQTNNQKLRLTQFYKGLKDYFSRCLFICFSWTF